MGYEKDIFGNFAYDFELSQNLYSVNHICDFYFIIRE